MNFLEILKVIGCSFLSWAGIESWCKAVEIMAIINPEMTAWQFVIRGTLILAAIGGLIWLFTWFVLFANKTEVRITLDESGN